jgi:uncharacterized protein YndB with AHSA1/START domain
MSPEAGELRLTRTVSASPERVFGLLVDPAELVRWWGQRGFTTPEAEVDLRVGGRYRFTMQPPDGDPFHLEPVPDGTTISLSQSRFATNQRLDLHRDGWTDSLERLAEVIDADQS